MFHINHPKYTGQAVRGFLKACAIKDALEIETGIPGTVSPA